MKQGYIAAIWVVLLSLAGCSQEPQSANTPPSNDVQNQSKNLNFNDIPNEKTTYQVIESRSVDENDALVAALKAQLLNDNFEFVEKEVGTSWTENDCTNNKVIQVKGEGIRSYRASSRVGMGEDLESYPDFMVLVFAFDQQQDADQAYQDLVAAVQSDGGFCNGKTPEKIVQHQRELFYFTAHKDVFRPYMEHYADFVAHFQIQSTTE